MYLMYRYIIANKSIKYKQMETRTYNVYKFSELSAKAKERALESLRLTNVDYDGWHDFVIEGWEEKLNKLGYKDAKIYFSGFYSQGDGACFEARIDVAEYIKAHKLSKKYPLSKKYSEYIRCSLKHGGHYYHSTMTDLRREIECAVADTGGDWDMIDAELSTLEDMILEERRNLGNKLYRELENAYSNLTENGAVIETIEANDYRFTIEGLLD